jgi:hypothetical protein
MFVMYCVAVGHLEGGGGLVNTDADDSSSNKPGHVLKSLLPAGAKGHGWRGVLVICCTGRGSCFCGSWAVEL